MAYGTGSPGSLGEGVLKKLPCFLILLWGQGAGWVDGGLTQNDHLMGRGPFSTIVGLSALCFSTVCVFAVAIFLFP